MINSAQLSYKSFFCRPNGSQLKLCLKIAEMNFSYFAKIPSRLEMVGRKISRTQRVKWEGDGRSEDNIFDIMH